LQPIIAGAARFPPIPDAQVALCDKSAELSQSFGELRSELKGLTKDLIGLQCASLASDPEARQAAFDGLGVSISGKKRKRPLDSDQEDSDDEGNPEDPTGLLRQAVFGSNSSNSSSKRRKPLDDSEGDNKAENEEDDDLSTDSLWRSLSKLQSAVLRPHCDATLNHWARKLAFSGGGVTARKLRAGGAGGAGVSSSLSVLTSDLTAQVDELLKSKVDRTRLVTRTRPTAETVKPLGVPSSTLASAANNGESSLLEHCYDDSGDFYQALLKELLATTTPSSWLLSSSSSSSSASAASNKANGAETSSLAALLGGDANAAAALLAKAQRKRVTRVGIDRRATKGRRLKFIVMPKLVGFMAPTPYVVAPDRAMDLDTLVNSLFKSSS
jgi:Apoptosis-antagonizing transcription factor, C-terminal/Apoptosis antagonizing transcription factor